MHWCHGCCATRREAVLLVTSLVNDVVFQRPIAGVAVRKWLSVMPAAQQVAGMACFHGMLQHCEAAVNGKRTQGDGVALPHDFAVQQSFEETRKA